MPGVWGVVVAGGSGERFGAPKQFALLAGRPVLEWSVAACRPTCVRVVLVLPKGDDALAAETPPYGADVVVSGGATRAASVRAGLAAVPDDVDLVVVHDAARPLAPPALFEAVVAALAEGAGGAVPALPVSDTLKRMDTPFAEGQPIVLETIDRRALVAVQTPQAFVAAVLRRAHATEEDATDDAALVEALGATVRVVPGDPGNLKLTTPVDLALAEQLLVR
ncbi:MAG TPA: 2-C-methyl-D-erythritol 4-phosphate cytidylyltransferase [Acidimicrobiales bacterium]|nr:2-C-methyl-D-erythritol 4-phosphate cytidylyltransferase [Acidimicrobiales bacterium]